MKLRSLLLIWAISCAAVSASAVEQCFELFSYQNPSLFQHIENLEIREVGFSKTQWTSSHFLADENIVQLTEKSLTVREVALRVVDLPSVESVIYPAAGYDAATAFVIFPFAHTVVGLDNHNFLNSGAHEIQLGDSLPIDSTQFTFAGDIDSFSDSQGMAPAIINRLFGALPNVRIHRVVEVRDRARVSHGWIEFDQGEGTLRRRYIHLNHSISPREISFWSIGLATTGFQGLIIKGALGAMNPQSAEGSYLLNYLRDHSGVVVDADGSTLESQVALMKSYGIEPQLKNYPGVSENFKSTSVPVSLGYDQTYIIKFGVRK